MRAHLIPILAPLLAALAPFAAAQAASETFLLGAVDLGSGGSASSASWRVTASFGDGVVAPRAAAGPLTLTGGYAAALEEPAAGRPMLLAVRPLYAPLLGGTPLALHGTELHVGPAASITIGGKSAAVGSRTRDRILTTLPRQDRPGWAPVAVAASGETSTLAQGVGVLPLLDGVPPPLGALPFDVVYRGAQHDLVVWLVALGRASPLPLPPLHHGLELDLSSLLVITVTPVTASDGVQELRIPGLRWGSRLHFQALVLSAAPGYLPGSFTNVFTH